MVDYHLVVLVHGLWGNPEHMKYLRSQIEAQANDKEQIYCYVTGSHSGFLTYDGIDVNGKRISDEILAVTKELSYEKDKVVKFSMVGYSLGGLISRYAVGYLHSQGYFEEIIPLNFTTFCTPHVGALNPGTSWGNKIFNFCVPYILAQTGTQMFLADGSKDRLPLLVWMSDSRSAFFKGLSSFKNKNLYANIINDKRTPYFTASISLQDPFKSMVNENASAYSLEFIEGYEPNVIDITKPIEFQSQEPQTTLERGRKSVGRKLNWFKIITKAILFTPVWFLWILGNSILQIIRNRKRVGEFLKANDISYLHHEQDAPVHNLESDISNNFKDTTDSFVESIFDAMNSDSYKNYHSYRTKASPSASTESLDSKLSLVNLKGQIEDFNLALVNLQKVVINNLNSLKWNKFPVLIRNTKQTHRAAIVRMPDPKFDEGKVVVRHFMNEVFEF
ncbi:lipid droplet phospholipase 1 [[Candida] jaroonii]|uniref:Lipid droplet phospholipase 1 n=1 Tax=[Candida] jaroonii TaxID=467808 RepID=A0ACA9Y3I0_9ASCO|nr:lipid droplet phospholipase 1 [[Candida] jaroonii]